MLSLNMWLLLYSYCTVFHRFRNFVATLLDCTLPENKELALYSSSHFTLYWPTNFLWSLGKYLINAAELKWNHLSSFESQKKNFLHNILKEDIDILEQNVLQYVHFSVFLKDKLQPLKNIFSLTCYTIFYNNILIIWGFWIKVYKEAR